MLGQIDGECGVDQQEGSISGLVCRVVVVVGGVPIILDSWDSFLADSKMFHRLLVSLKSGKQRGWIFRLLEPGWE